MKTIWIIIISVVVTAGVSGGSIYAYQNNKTSKDKEALQNQITTLESTKTDLEKQVTNLTSATATSNNGNSSSTSSSSETTSWKTYTNSRVNYSFGYPSNGLQLNLDETIKYPSTRDGDSKTEDLVQFATASTTYSVRTDVSGHVTSVEAWITGGSEDPSHLGFPSTDLSDYSKTTVGGQTAYTYKNGLVTYAVIGTKFYTIAAYTGITPKTDADSTYSHLLSSFAFTK